MKRVAMLLSGAALASLAVYLQAQAPARQGDAVTLPDSPVKDTVESACSACHGLQLLTLGSHDRAEWQLTMDRMITAGAKVPPDQVEAVTDYLARNFPGTPPPAAVVVPGKAKVSFKEWQVPSKGARPHDPLATPDGALWYTGQYANVLGRVDLKSGAIKEFPLRTPQSGPHGLAADRDGNIWFTANSKGYIGKLDPKTGDVAEYKLPEGMRDPHTPIFDQKGILWFTAQGANMIGRLDPKTGDVKVVTSPTPRSNPYGMVVSSKGVPFFVEFGAPKVAKIDPETMQITEYPLPDEKSRPRRIAITSDDVIWYSDYSRGYLGRLDPATGQVKEWPSPGGPKSLPYGITVFRDVIWYSESGVKPNTIVRFDPRTEKFQTWTIPSGGGVVRNMMATRDGNLVIAESGVNKVALVEVAR